MREELRMAMQASRELMAVHCTAAETEILLKAAINSPPRGASSVEAVQAIAIAITMNPGIRHDLIQLAHLPKEDRERVQEIAAFEREHLPRFNVGYPYSSDEFFETLRAFIRGLWTDSHESCLDGAIMVGVIPLQDRWTLNAFAMVKCMRETAEADRTMRCGYGSR